MYHITGGEVCFFWLLFGLLVGWGDLVFRLRIKFPRNRIPDTRYQRPETRDQRLDFYEIGGLEDEEEREGFGLMR